MITGRTRFAGVIGHPVGHSLSPAMHNAAFDALGMDYRYAAFDVAPDAVGDALRGMAALGFAGFNVTIPHKPAIYSLVDAHAPSAEAVRAVNTVEIRDGRTIGHNTDGEGFARSLEEAGVSLQDRRVVLLGAGGAARSVAAALQDRGAASLTILNRTLERAEELIQWLGARVDGGRRTEDGGRRTGAGREERGAGTERGERGAGTGREERGAGTEREERGAGMERGKVGAQSFARPIRNGARVSEREASAPGTTERGSVSDRNNRAEERHPQNTGKIVLSAGTLEDGESSVRSANIVVQCTSVGMYPRQEDPPPIPACWIHPSTVVYDLIYNPQETRLLSLARAAGARTLNGVEMLIYQGAIAFEIWTGIFPPVDVMRQALLKALEEQNRS